jgi:O-antigen/teichoic acid export membrane protein
MKIKSENTKNALMVISSNLLTIVIALFTGFIIPIKISVADYAYYHVYCLYIAYAGFFHLGLVNGIYLKYGHLDENQLPVNRFRRYGNIMVVLQMAFVVILAVLLFVFQPADSNNTLAYAFIILNIPLTNIKWFYSSMNQFTKRFVIDSMVTYLQNVLTLVMV